MLQRRAPMRRTGIARRGRKGSGRARPNEPLATWCQAQIPHDCAGRAVHRHHIVTRGRGGTDDASNTIDLCHIAHDWIHAHPAEATEAGLLRRAGAS